ncbi:MAG TPA: hypothetical protein VGJ15_05190 [Pirellulales bacterium]|jgi:hypothetical protein
MTQRPFRFLHSSDLRLDRPAVDVVDPPEQLFDLLVDCPIRAATRLFDAAVDQHVDFVVFSGNVVDMNRCGPREVLFLIEQFQRLANTGIAVYWCGGPLDSSLNWPVEIHWPGKVQFFKPGHVQRFQHEIASAAVCEIVGRSHDASGPPRSADFSVSSGELFSIAVAHASWNCSVLAELEIDYWALGGAHQRSTPLAATTLAHYPGSPQGRRLAEPGAHSCTLVAVDEHANVRLTPVATDVVRWHHPIVSLADSAEPRDLEKLLRDRAAEIVAQSSGVANVVTWKINCNSPRIAPVRGHAAGEIAAKLRKEFGTGANPLWTNEIEIDLPQRLPTAWLNEDTIRGDFLQAVAERIAHAGGDANSVDDLIDDEFADNIHAEPALLNADDLPANFAARLNWSPEQFDDHNHPEFRRSLLAEVAWLGADLLGPSHDAAGGSL